MASHPTHSPSILTHADSESHWNKHEALHWHKSSAQEKKDYPSEEKMVLRSVIRGHRRVLAFMALSGRDEQELRR